MRIRKRALLGLLLVSAVTLAAACSQAPSEPEAQQASVERPNREEFVAEVKPICAELDDKLHDFEDPQHAAPKDFGAAADRYTESVQGEITQLLELTAPAEMEAQWTAFIASLERSLDKAELTAELVSAKNYDTIPLRQAWTENKTARARAMELADEMDLGACEDMLAPSHH